MVDQPEEPNREVSEAQEPAIDPVRLQMIEQKLQSEQNLGMGIAAGLVAALLGAAVWGAFTFYTGYVYGIIAVGVGFLVGYAVRTFGKGLSNLYGVIAALLAFFGCALGNLLTVTASLAKYEGVPFFEALSKLDLELIQELMVASFEPLDLLFYGFAIYEAYVIAFRRLSQEELQELLSSEVTPTDRPY